MPRLLSTSNRALLIVVASIAATGCGSKDDGPPRPSSAPIPDVRGITLEQAEKRLQARKLEWGIAEDAPTYTKAGQSSGGANRAKADWRVVAQDPGPGGRLSLEGADSILLTTRRP